MPPRVAAVRARATAVIGGLVALSVVLSLATLSVPAASTQRSRALLSLVPAAP